jgi:hypothetical protein
MRPYTQRNVGSTPTRPTATRVASQIGRWPNGQALVSGNENHRLHHSGETSLSARAAPDLTRGASARTAHACSTARAPGLYPGTTGSTPGVGSSSSNRRDPTRTKALVRLQPPSPLMGASLGRHFPFRRKNPPRFLHSDELLLRRGPPAAHAHCAPRTFAPRSPFRSSTRRCPTSSPHQRHSFEIRDNDGFGTRTIRFSLPRLSVSQTQAHVARTVEHPPRTREDPVRFRTWAP